MRPPTRRIILLVMLSLLPACGARAWDPVTHVAITRAAMTTMSGALVRDPELSRILIASSMAPDFAMAADGRADGPISRAAHDPDFARAIFDVATGLSGRARDRLNAVACGWLAHIQADGVAHGAGGYPNATHLFDRLVPSGHYLPSHLATEFCVGVLDYAADRTFHDGLPVYMPGPDEFASILDAYRKRKRSQRDATAATGGEDPAPMNEAAYGEAVERFRLFVEAKTSLARAIIGARPKLVAQIDARFADRASGIGERGGVEQSVAAVRSALIARNDGTAVPDDAAVEDLAAAAQRETRDQMVRADRRTTLDLTIASVRVSERVADQLGEQVRVGSAEDSRVYRRFVQGLLLEDELDLAEIITWAQGDVAPTGSRTERLRQLDEQVGIARRRVASFERRTRPGLAVRVLRAPLALVRRAIEPLEGQVHRLGSLGRLLEDILGQADRERLEEASAELARWEAELEKVRGEVDPVPESFPPASLSLLGLEGAVPGAPGQPARP